MRTHNKNMKTTPEKILQQMEMLTGKREKSWRRSLRAQKRTSRIRPGTPLCDEEKPICL
jgi:hypothetical protein